MGVGGTLPASQTHPPAPSSTMHHPSPRARQHQPHAPGFQTPASGQLRLSSANPAPYPRPSVWDPGQDSFSSGWKGGCTRLSQRVC